MKETPFITMLYTFKGERKEYKCDFPNEFLQEFEDKNQEDYEIAFFFVMGNDQANVRALSDAFKICKA